VNSDIGNSKTLKKISMMASNRVMPYLKRLTAQTITKVFVVDIPTPVLKEAILFFENNSTELGQLGPLLNKHPRNRDGLSSMFSALSKYKTQSFFFVYNLKDDKFEIVVSKT